MDSASFIAPDESYLIFDSEREHGFGNMICILVLNKKTVHGAQPLIWAIKLILVVQKEEDTFHQMESIFSLIARLLNG